jgi:hypothetical protein
MIIRASEVLKRFRFLLPLLAAVLVAGIAPDTAQAQSGDNFEGAVWGFTMTPRTKGLKTLKGQFRVSGGVIYQKETPEDPEFSKQVGTKHPRRGRTRIAFTDLRAFDADKTPRTDIKGTARLTLDKIGAWSGLFTDGEGRNWNFKCTRIKE